MDKIINALQELRFKYHLSMKDASNVDIAVSILKKLQDEMELDKGPIDWRR